MKRIPNTTCAVCEEAIYRRPSQIENGNVYCSLTCSGKNQQKTKICPICADTYIGNKKTCSRTCANKTRAGITYTKNAPHDKYSQGRMLKKKLADLRGGVCETCGHANYAILQVHHKKERYLGGTDNFDNLAILCPNCHMTHHLGQVLFNSEKMI